VRALTEMLVAYMGLFGGSFTWMKQLLASYRSHSARDDVSHPKTT